MLIFDVHLISENIMDVILFISVVLCIVLNTESRSSCAHLFIYHYITVYTRGIGAPP